MVGNRHQILSHSLFLWFLFDSFKMDLLWLLVKSKESSLEMACECKWDALFHPSIVSLQKKKKVGSPNCSYGTIIEMHLVWEQLL